MSPGWFHCLNCWGVGKNSATRGQTEGPGLADGAGELAIGNNRTLIGRGWLHVGSYRVLDEIGETTIWVHHAERPVVASPPVRVRRAADSFCRPAARACKTARSSAGTP